MTVSASDFSVGLAHKFCAAAAKTGIAPDQINSLAESESGMAEFSQFIGNGCRLTLVVRPGNWPIWKTLTIGGKSADELLAALKVGEFSVSDWARDIMRKPAFTTLPSPTEISLVRVKVGDLGFNDPRNLPTTTALFARAQEFGLVLCPAEAGPHLRLAFANQPCGDWFWVAMEPITYSDGRPLVFYVERADDGERWLYTSYAYPGHRWHLEYEIVFCLSK